MAWKGDSDRYGPLASALHWIAAAGTLALLVLGFAAAGASTDGARAAILRFHVPLGLLVFVLTLVRAVWWALDRRPEPPPGQPRWQARVAYATHLHLVLFTIVLGISGVGMMARSGAGPILFAGAPGPLADFSKYIQFSVHGTVAALLIALLFLHVLAALHHQFVRRDALFARIALRSRGR